MIEISGVDDARPARRVTAEDGGRVEFAEDYRCKEGARAELCDLPNANQLSGVTVGNTVSAVVFDSAEEVTEAEIFPVSGSGLRNSNLTSQDFETTIEDGLRLSVEEESFSSIGERALMKQNAEPLFIGIDTVMVRHAGFSQADIAPESILIA